MSKYFQVKLKWVEPKENSDQMKKVSKKFLVRADSCTEAEARVVNWCPGNYQDARVKATTEDDKLVELVRNGDSEKWWYFTLSDENDKGKFVPFNIAVNGDHEQEVLKKVKELFRMSQFEAMRVFKVVVDDDLVSEEIPKPRFVDPGDAEPSGAKLFIQQGSKMDLDDEDPF